jgi:hypothetical protein
MYNATVAPVGIAVFLQKRPRLCPSTGFASSGEATPPSRCPRPSRHARPRCRGRRVIASRRSRSRAPSPACLLLPPKPSPAAMRCSHRRQGQGGWTREQGRKATQTSTCVDLKPPAKKCGAELARSRHQQLPTSPPPPQRARARGSSCSPPRRSCGGGDRQAPAGSWAALLRGSSHAPGEPTIHSGRCGLRRPCTAAAGGERTQRRTG